LGNLSTPKSVQKLQTALHAKAKAEAGYRFYALYDKISREAHAYAQCRSNKGAPGVDGHPAFRRRPENTSLRVAPVAQPLRDRPRSTSAKQKSP
jgi:hypothetical protein